MRWGLVGLKRGVGVGGGEDNARATSWVRSCRASPFPPHLQSHVFRHYYLSFSFLAKPLVLVIIPASEIVARHPYCWWTGRSKPRKDGSCGVCPSSGVPAHVS